jgi:hypothetical protein
MVAMHIALLTGDRPPTDVVLQSQRCLLSASPQWTIRASASGASRIHATPLQV